jgi:hypothetical protein
MRPLNAKEIQEQVEKRVNETAKLWNLGYNSIDINVDFFKKHRLNFHPQLVSQVASA